MFNASNRTTRFVSFAFAVVMAIVVNGSMLLTFDSAAHEVVLAQNAQAPKVAVLETVTIVGRHT